MSKRAADGKYPPGDLVSVKEAGRHPCHRRLRTSGRKYPSMPGRLRFGSASGTAQAGCESLPERLWNTNCTMPGHGKKNRRLDRAIPAHGLGRALHEAVRGRHDALPQYRQNAGLQRNRQFVPVVRLGRQRGDVRRRDGGRGAAGGGEESPYHRLGAGSADAGAAYRLAGGAGVLCRKDEQRGHAADPAAVGRVL